jgi:RES domain-containing protein
VHIEDPRLLPELIMVTYDIPDTLGVETVDLNDLPSDWRRQEVWTQQRGDAWHQERSTPLLRVPSAIVPIVRSPDLNIVVNHSHPAASEMKIIAAEPFVLDPRLF